MVEELLGSGLQEKKYFDKYVEDNSTNVKRNTLHDLNKKLEFTVEDVKEYHTFINLVTIALEKKQCTDFEDSITNIIHSIIQERDYFFC